ncbi:MAG: DNA gyrase inhibitor YacG [Candidatus Koribacter versatilis]|uniref:DNA gyrase inhibitor YacG n=1 Tax=Candidatus Korobacter versatilis TaxID=658062 RepID=A0A932ENI9_9BACT|nr:DNA gyrase inhibitor YacG [Candidatus Koribacter versatilis]
MAKKRTRSLRCPICRTIVLRSEPDFPFCSGRCRTIDLGKWASGGYVVSTPINDPEAYEDAQRQADELRRKTSDGEDSGRD